MAKDKFGGNCETEERIHSVLDAHIGRNVLCAVQQRENALLRLNDALARNATDMQVRPGSHGGDCNQFGRSINPGRIQGLC